MTYANLSSVSYDQDEILQAIQTLYCPQGFECDVTYSKGQFYKTINPPPYKFDIAPQVPGVVQADCRVLPIKDASIHSLVFDPPFVAGGLGGSGVIKARFGQSETLWVESLWELYKAALKEFARVLVKDGILVVKSQDTVNNKLQYLSHVEIINQAIQQGFYPIDIFVLLAKIRLTDPRWKHQEHARKYHSYFIVFVRQPCPVVYPSLRNEK